jgi:hypothetical protein
MGTRLYSGYKNPVFSWVAFKSGQKQGAEFCLLTFGPSPFSFFNCRKGFSVFIFPSTLYESQERGSTLINITALKNCRFKYLYVTIALLFFLGHTSNLLARQPDRSKRQAINIERILVLPIQVATEYHQAGSTVRCYECQYFVQTGKIEAGADAFMNEQILTYISNKTPYKAIAYWKLEWVTAENLAQDFRSLERPLLVEMGKSVKADALLVGTIYRFRQRVGSALGADSPASVAFALELIRVADGRVIWRRPFDQTQQSLDQNLLNVGKFFKRGGKWITAEDLASEGLKEIMATLPMP